VTDPLPDTRLPTGQPERVDSGALMAFAEVVSLVITLVKLGPDMQGVGEWYRGTWMKVRAFFRRNRESNHKHSVRRICRMLTPHSF
jgi:hypothetical protein